MSKLLLLVVSVAALGCSTPASRADAAPPPAETAGSPNALRLERASLSFVDTREWKNEPAALPLRLPAKLVFREGAVANVGTPVAGRVTTVHVIAGERVEKNTPLVTVKSPDAASARAVLAATRASLDAARVNAERAQRMLERGVGTQKEKLDADLRVAELEAELARARTTVSFVGAGAGGDVVIRAPIAGNVIARNVTSGASVGADGAALVSIGDPSDVWVEADVFERDLAAVRVGQKASVALASSARSLTGRVQSIGAVVSSDLRAAPVRIALDELHADLRPGMFGRVEIEVESSVGVLPTAAILIRDGREYVVFVEKAEGTFERRAVRVGNSYGGNVQVLEGLAVGERVVVRGALLLDGALDQMI